MPVSALTHPRSDNYKRTRPKAASYQFKVGPSSDPCLGLGLGPISANLFKEVSVFLCILRIVRICFQGKSLTLREHCWTTTHKLALMGRCPGLVCAAPLVLKLPTITQPPQVCFDGLLLFRGLGAYEEGDVFALHIEGQKEHHRRRTFQEEYREFLRRYEVPYDERYVWD